MAHARPTAPKLSLAGLRHEIMTPVNHIIGYAEMLLDELQQPGFSSISQNLTRIRETAREMSRSIERILSPRARRRLAQALAELREEITQPIHTILQTVGAITSEDGNIAAIGDVIAIGRAAAELLEFAQGRRTFDAPQVQGEAQSGTPQRRPAPLSGRILVVDDNRTSRELTVRLLKRQGHHVTAVSSGAEALAVMLQTSQDLVLLDMLMPKLDGFQVLERIKADPSLKAIPVIVISALNEVPGIVRCLEIGAEDYLFKPFDPVLLGARLQSSLEKKRLHDLEKRRSADLERAFEQLHANEQRLRLALAADRASIWDWDPATNKILELVQPGAPQSREMERSLDQMIERVHPDDREHVRRNLAEALEARHDFHDQYRVVARDGSTVWFETMGALQLGPGGAAQRMIGVTRDITHRKRLDDALRRSNQDFQRFAMAASHDLQEPLRAVGGGLEGLAQRLRGEDQRVIRASIDSLARMSKLISDLLDYSQMSTQQARRQPVSSEAVLSLVLNDLKLAIEDSGARIEHGKLPAVWADFMMLHRLFQNLISNSIKYRGKQPPRIQLAAVRKGDWWTFSVADNGVGIDPKYKDAIFGVFRRLHGPDVPGSGLGLAICHRIVEQFGGKIWMESAAGKGSTFYFNVPALPAK
ncbi:MAG: response regulator [Acidobacteriia bacterium]|nr:response regulator [Terriglobia bacterium]